MIRAGLAVLLGAAALGGCTQKWDTGNSATADTRLARDVALDARRHGPEIAAFAGLKSGDKVIDLIPGGGYWTRTFARIVGPSGHVYGIWPKPYAMESGSDVKRYAAAAGTPAFANVSASTQPATSLAAPEKVDLVFTSQNYHDYPDKFMGSIDPAVLNKAVFDALKPGGIYLIIDHAAAAGSGMRDTDTLHRIDPATVKQQVTAAGFVFEGESKLLANAEDDHSKPVFDKSIRGHTDQFIFKFRRP
ncbi:methyltransferase [Sphingomonas sp.]|uniref:class I SAM-dependent methyltransferase n=1 Tax=Sphingomonas sp. TaxID=28214 RepID=UPI0025DB9B8C|nr:methyltransferase [Sphingomonas sp.]